MRYVPQLRRNQVSLGVMYSLEHFIQIEKGIIKVISGSLISLKENKFNRLYILLGNIGQNRDIIAFTQEDDLAMVWHNKLGHMNEKG